MWKVGAHCRGYNETSIGVCLVGGTDVNDRKKASVNFTLAQYKTLCEWIKYLNLEYGPDLAVVGHRAFNATKACPGFSVVSLISQLGEDGEMEKPPQ